MDHSELIRKCIGLAERSVQNGNHPFGALLAIGEEVILTAENTVLTDGDTTRHAELNLVSAAMREIASEELSRSTLYTSTEPCAMCSGAIYRAGIPRVVFGCSAETMGEVTGRSADITSRRIFALGQRAVEVTGPILEEEAADTHRSFWKKA